MSSSSNDDGDPDQLVPPIDGSLMIYDDTAGDLIYSRDYNSQFRLNDYEPVAFNDRIGHLIRIEFMAEDSFAGVPPSNEFSGARATHPESWLRTTVSLNLVPEPTSQVMAAFVLMAMLDCVRRERNSLGNPELVAVSNPDDK